jgi:hypothetical protein
VLGCIHECLLSSRLRVNDLGGRKVSAVCAIANVTILTCCPMRSSAETRDGRLNDRQRSRIMMSLNNAGANLAARSRQTRRHDAKSDVVR